MQKRLLKFLPPALGLLVLGGVAIGLHGALKKISLGDIMAALDATSLHQILQALATLACCICIMSGYDLPGIFFARRLAAFPRLGLLRVGLASFCAYALSHVLGAPALSSAAIRFRLYAQWGVPPAGIARIIALSCSSFTLGFITLLGGLLLLSPLSVPVFGDTAPLLLRCAGAGLLALIAAYVLAARHREALVLFGRTLPLPGARLALAQITISCVDIAAACGVLHAILPAAPGLTYPHMLSLYLAAFASGMFSGLPGGVGVFDSVLLLGLSAYLPPATALGAILLFRVMYFLAPACLAGILYAGHELWVQAYGHGEKQ
jgi:uncharacterized membrane protein YbhN (UPF0104 family)